MERWSLDGGVSWGRKGLGTARGFSPPLSLVIYVTIPLYSLALKKKQDKDTVSLTSHYDCEY